MKIKSVKSINPCISVIQTGYDIVKAHDGELTVEKREKEETVFSIKLPL
jgi:signal transduction histidine kinase